MNKVFEIFFRYFLILLGGVGNLYIFYALFTPLTIYASYFVFSLAGNTILVDNYIIFNESVIQLVDACVAGSAYYLLFLLNLSTPNINLLRRVKLFIFSFISLFLLNILRIFIMGLLIGTGYFEEVHLLFWYFISIIFVVAIWFSGTKLFKVKSVPIYSDLLAIKNLKKTKTRN